LGGVLAMECALSKWGGGGGGGGKGGQKWALFYGGCLKEIKKNMDRPRLKNNKKREKETGNYWKFE